MAEEKTQIDRILSDMKALDERRLELIHGLLKERELALHSFDEQLARLGHGSEKPKRSHHKQVKPITESRLKGKVLSRSGTEG